MIRTVRATRYALAMREGGSLPGLVEADDLGFYVVKFRGAGQGPLALVAELVAGEIGRRLGLAIPELVFVDVDPVLGRNDPDAEIRHLLKASVGINLGLDYLPGSIMFDREAGDIASAEVASMAVWFDAFVQNVDRTARNPNLLVWHRSLHFIDHGAALYFHHNWQSATAKAESSSPDVAKHLLLPWASAIPEAAAKAKSLLNTEVLAQILALLPDEWIESGERTAQERRNDYLEYLTRRLAASANFEEEAMRTRDPLL